MSKTEPKPIFIIGIPHHPFVSGDTLMKTYEDYSDRFPDYHVVMYVHPYDDFKFQCFYNKDIREADIEEMKRYIKEQVKQMEKEND